MDNTIDMDNLPEQTEMDAFNSSSYYPKQPEIGFGTSSRPPLYNPSNVPGPGAYAIKTTMGKIMDSNFKTPNQYSLRGRTHFGDPNPKNKTREAEPGPGAYSLDGHFLYGKDPRISAFPKTGNPIDKSGMGPGPGSYSLQPALGKQVVSTIKTEMQCKFLTQERPGLAVKSQSDVGPGEYGAFKSACDVQVESNKKTSGKIKFGTGYRKYVRSEKKDMSEPAPGPGSYDMPGNVGTFATGSPYRSSPSASMSGRNKFGSPW
jgi:hypothetical protein